MEIMAMYFMGEESTVKPKSAKDQNPRPRMKKPRNRINLQSDAFRQRIVIVVVKADKSLLR